MFITSSGTSQKKNKQGLSYGWTITDFTLIERWVPDDILNQSGRFSKEEAGLKIREQIRRNEKGIDDKSIERFIGRI
jgi:hypothetical protein